MTDSLTNETLIGASVYFPDLGIGDITNLEGRYRIENIPPNIHTVQVSYIGYITKTVELDLRNEGTTQLDIVLQSSVVEGEEIFVLAQAAGQIAAIKEQLESNTIVNVVSKERLSELPDQNAAESVARLPGVSVQRDAGEAAKVVVRGLSPRFNSITVNGVRVPGTEDDRSVDLSLLPSDVLDGIQVFKALTPDMDADAVGGTVNLQVKKAPNGFRSSGSFEYGYNDIREEFGEYKGSLNSSNRYLDDKFGILLSGSIQRANRSSLLYDLDPEFNQMDSTINDIENLNFTDNFQIRDRYGGSASFDYVLNENNNIYLTSLFGKTDRDEQRFRKRYRVGNSRTEYDARDRQRYELLYSNILGGEHSFGYLKLDWLTSYSYTLAKQTYGNYARFLELGAYNDDLDNTNVQDVVDKAWNNLSSTYFQYGTNETFRNTESDFTSGLDVQLDFELNANVSGFFKAGSKYRDKYKT
ncbi:MAG: TonB-dependent receptor plug domain-containing protein, partial [Balneolales bacterium]|nr:TonB-dependent receptor plug domain-containing protein [Balneolales bacterium]